MIDLLPYIPRPALEWARQLPGEDPGWREVPGTMVFGDISGFTKMSERLARHGKVGAEEVADAINACFASLLDIAYGQGGSLLKFGGDALLLFFDGDDHVRRAAHAAHAMRARLRRAGRIDTSAGLVVLRISIGVHTGTFRLLLVGTSHREFVVCGPAASATVAAEAGAGAGQIVVSAATAAALPRSWLGAATGDGYLLRTPATRPRRLPVVMLDDTAVDTATLVPRAIRRHLEDGGSEPEHRVATVAFIHFDGTDDIVTNHGTSELATRLHDLVTIVQEAADEHAVTFLGSDIDADGGKVILVSGVPSRVGDDEERLLSALRQIVRSPLPLPVRIGAHCGPVFSGDVGPPYRRTFTVMGDTVNLAARVMSKASPGQVLVTPDVLDRSTLGFDTEAIEPFTVKGKRRPVTAFALGEPRRSRDVRGGLLPLVGRDDERARLADDVAAVRGGSTRLVEIVGPHGIGKSRLVEEVRAACNDAAAPDAVGWITIVCQSYEAATPYAPFRVLARHLLGVDVDGTSDAAGEALEGHVDAHAAHLRPVLALLGAVLGVEFAETPEIRALEPEFRRQRTDEAAAALLRGLLRPPTVVVFEDAHHMDDASRTLLLQLVADHGCPGVLVVVTRRDSGAPLLDADAVDVATMPLSPLTPEQATDALVRATEDDPLLPSDVRALAERATGNPLFLEELLQATRAGASLEALPASVDAAVTAQIDRLPVRLRRILQCAAVLGQAFTATLLDDLLQPNGLVFDGAAQAHLAAFVVPSGAGVFRFRSTVSRDCAYEELPYRRRSQLHEQAAQALVARVGPDADEGLLSMHFLHAQRFEEAWRLARIAADRAQAGYANVEAEALYERALAAGRRLPDLRAADVAAVWESLGDVRERTGRYDTAARAYREARRLLHDQPVGNASLCLKEAWLPERRGRHAEAVRWIRRGLHVVDDLDGREASSVRSQLTVWYAAIRQAQGRHREAVTWCEQAVAEAQRCGDKDAEAHALFILDWALVSLGRLELATHSERALGLYAELGDLGGEAVVLNNLGGFAYFRGAWDQAVVYYERGRDARLRTGNDIEAATGTCNIGEVLIDQGHHDEAQALLDEALRVWRAGRYRPGIAYARSLMGRLAARRGRFDEARMQLQSARADYGAVGLAGLVRCVDGWTAECLVFEGRPVEALSAVDALERADGADWPDADDLALLERVRGQAHFQLGDDDRARAAFARSIAAAEARAAEYELALSRYALVQLTRPAGGAGTGDEAGAGDLERRCMETFTRLGVLTVPVVPRGPLAAAAVATRFLPETEAAVS